MLITWILAVPTTYEAVPHEVRPPTLGVLIVPASDIGMVFAYALQLQI